MGAEVIDLGIGADSADDLTAKIKVALDQDFLLLSGGVSAGTMDLVPGILESLGVVQVFHKVKVKPGKPIFFGRSFSVCWSAPVVSLVLCLVFRATRSVA